MENQLAIIVNESGLEETKAQYILDRFQEYFTIAAKWELKAKSIVVTNETQVAEMKMARAGRLFLKEKRIAIENARKHLKEQSLRESRAIDGIANVLKALIIPIEKYLDEQEHFIEIKAAKAAAEKERKEAERLEAERIAREKAEVEERERIRVENEKLKVEAEKKERALILERKKKVEAESKKREADEAREKAERQRLEAIVKKKAAETKARREKMRADMAEAKIHSVLNEIQRKIECPFCHKSFTYRFKIPKEKNETSPD